MSPETKQPGLIQPAPKVELLPAETPKASVDKMIEVPAFVTEALNAEKSNGGETSVDDKSASNLHENVNGFDKQVTPADVVSPSLAQLKINSDMMQAAARSIAGDSEQESPEQS